MCLYWRLLYFASISYNIPWGFRSFARRGVVTSSCLRSPSAPLRLPPQPPRASMSPRTLSSPALFAALILIVVVAANGQSRTATGTRSVAPTTVIPPTPSTQPTATASFVPGLVALLDSSSSSSYSSSDSRIAVKSDGSAFVFSQPNIGFSGGGRCLYGCFGTDACSYNRVCIYDPSPSTTVTPSSTPASKTATSTGSASSSRVGGAVASPSSTMPFTFIDNSYTSISISGVAFDARNNLFISDNGYRRLLHYNTTSFSYTEVSSGLFICAEGIAVFAATSDVFIADRCGSCIKMWSLSGQVLTSVAGVCGSSGYNGNAGVATSVQLHNPMSVSLDVIGNAYFFDDGNNCVRKLTKASGNISSIIGICNTQYFGAFVGGGVGSSTSLPNSYRRIATDSAGNVYLGGLSRYVVKWSAVTGIIDVVPGLGNNYGGGNSFIASISVDNVGNMYFIGFNFKAYVLRMAISSSPSSLPTPSISLTSSQTPTATVTPYCAPSLFRALPRMDLVGTLVGSAVYPGVGFYTETEAACRQACCDAAVCDSFSFAAGAAAFYPVGMTTATPTATASSSPTQFNYYGFGIGGNAFGSTSSSFAYGAQCYLFVNVTSLVPSNIMSSGVLTSKYS